MVSRGCLRQRSGRLAVGLGLGLLVLAGALASTATVPAAPGPLREKQAEARRVLDEIRELDSRVETAVEAYNLATIELEQTETSLRANARRLQIARKNVRLAQRILARHVVDLYTSGESGSTLEIVLGSESLGEVLDRLEAERRIAEQDNRIVEQVRIARHALAQRQAQLARARERRRRLVAERAAHREAIEGQLAERQRLVDSIRTEIARLEAEERVRQERLRRQAEARLAAERAAARRAAARQEARPQEHAEEEPVVGVVAVAPEGVAVAPPAKYTGVVGIAMRYLGIPYTWGGASPETGFDCSGFVLYVYAQVGVSLPHNAAMQYGYGVPVSKAELQPGDLVFFDSLGHNGIYIGGGQFIHSPRTGDVVKISSLSEPWYTAKWVGARRIL